MSNSAQKIESKVEITTCYLCSMDVPIDKTMEIPLTTGGTVRVHPSCMEFYMSKTSVASGCAGCTGGKGCC